MLCRHERRVDRVRLSAKGRADAPSNLRDADLLVSDRVEAAMRRVDRACYVPAPASPRAAYQDAPQLLGFGATISAPHMHAHACEALLPRLQPGARVLGPSLC